MTFLSCQEILLHGGMSKIDEIIEMEKTKSIASNADEPIQKSDMRRFTSYVEEIHWERIYLSAVLRAEEEIFSDIIEAYLLNTQGVVHAEFAISYPDACHCVLTLNVTNCGTNRCINNGTYTILLLNEENHCYSEPQFAGDVEQLTRWSHVYRYNGNKGAYTITFMLDEKADFPRFQLLFFNSVVRAMGNIRSVEVKRRSEDGEFASPEDLNEVGHVEHGHGRNLNPYVRVKRKILRLKNRFYSYYRHKLSHKVVKKFYQFFLCLSRSNEKKCIVFFSQLGDELSTNMKALYDRMLDRGLKDEFEIVTSLRNSTVGKQSYYSIIKMVRDVASADFLIVDDHSPLLNWLVLNRKTTVIQIWHAGAGFKGVGYSRWGHYGCPGPYSAHRQYTYAISASAKISGFFAEQFGILEEQVIPTGMPRMDLFLDEDKRKQKTEEIYRQYPGIRGKKTILFAPTYRGGNRKEAHYPYDMVDFDALYRYCCDADAVVLFKMHPWVSDSVPIKEMWVDRFYDLNKYPDINDLFNVTDVLITDYSSSMFEYALMNKPMLAYAFDRVQISSTRGFHRSYEDNVPGKICDSFEELLESLRDEDYQFEKHADYMERHFEHVDTHNSDRVIDWLIYGQMPEEYRSRLMEKTCHIENVLGRCYDDLIWMDKREA